MEFEAEGQEFAKFLRSLELFIQTVKGQNNFWQQNVIIIKIGKKYWDLEIRRKNKKKVFLSNFKG